MGNDTIKGGAGGDILKGGAGDDKLFGDQGNDKIYGGSGADHLFGDQGSDRLYGGMGDDKLHGGDGDDRLYGGAGADTFVYAAGDGHDRIVDFADGKDRIDLSAFWDIGAVNDLSVTQDGANVVIDLPGRDGDTITIENFNLADLDDADFVFHQEAIVDGM
ncbi:MAG: calcium-binding protein [Rhodospirillaceae bacterium]|nr:calcium-binding protein [Rhodospirillaceae bacterium]